MWCARCRQETGSVAADGHTSPRCPRCQSPLASSEASSRDPECEAGELLARVAEHELEQFLSSPPLPPAPTVLRFDPAHPGPSVELDQSPTGPAENEEPSPSGQSNGRRVKSGTVRVLGTMLAHFGVFVLSAGAALLGIALFHELGDLQTIGSLAALLGQTSLLAGWMMLVSAGLRDTKAETHLRLEEMSRRLSSAERTPPSGSSNPNRAASLVAPGLKGTETTSPFGASSAIDLTDLRLQVEALVSQLRRLDRR